MKNIEVSSLFTCPRVYSKKSYWMMMGARIYAKGTEGLFQFEIDEIQDMTPSVLRGLLLKLINRRIRFVTRLSNNVQTSRKHLQDGIKLLIMTT